MNFEWNENQRTNRKHNFRKLWLYNDKTYQLFYFCLLVFNPQYIIHTLILIHHVLLVYVI